MNGNGWKQTDAHTLEVDWDSDNNICDVRTRVALIKKGCGCKTGCMTKRCKCKKSGNYCGPGCSCLSCCNSQAQPTQGQVEIEVVEAVNPESDESDSDLEEEVDNIMYSVFGPGSDSDPSKESDHAEFSDSCSSIYSDSEPQISDEEMDVDNSDM